MTRSPHLFLVTQEDMLILSFSSQIDSDIRKKRVTSSGKDRLNRQSGGAGASSQVRGQILKALGWKTDIKSQYSKEG